TVHRSIVGAVRGEDLHLSRVVAGPMFARGSVSITQGGCGPVIAGEGVSIREGGCGPVMAAGDVSIEFGGCGPLMCRGDARFGSGAFVGAVVSPRVHMEDGARVLMSTPQAVAMGAAFGVIFGLLARRRR